MSKFRLRKVALGISLAVLNIISNLLAGLALEGGWLVVLIALGVGVISAAIYFLVRPNRITVRIEQSIAMREDRGRYARQGLIVLLSDYSPQSPAGKALTAEQRKKAVEEGDYQILDVENSNLVVAISAVLAHKGQLKHCWFITTSSSDKQRNQSILYAPVMEKYFKEQHNMGECKFYFGNELTIPIEDDDAITRKTRDVVAAIFKQAKSNNIQLSDDQIVADITGGLKSMSLGIILGCLDKQRTLQYVASHYDADGDRTSEPAVPLLIDFEPEFIEE